MTNVDNSVSNRHFRYLEQISKAYKNRDVGNNLEICIELCKKDIALYPKLRNEWLHPKLGRPFSEDNWPRVPSFSRLAIIYEKLGKYQEAIEVCELAQKYNLNENISYDERIERIRKKMK